MNKKTPDIDIPKMFARFAETQNVSQTAREFGISRHHVRTLWNDLNEEDRAKYQKRITEVRDATIETYESEVIKQTKSYLERLDAVKLELLGKLEKCISVVEPTMKGSISALKDASVVIKNIQPPLDDETSNTGYSLLEKFTKISKLNDRKS